MARTYGVRIYLPSYTQAFKINLMKLLLEKYLDIAIMTFLNVHAWLQYPELAFWDTPWNTFNSLFNIIWIIYLVIFPIYAYIVIRMNRNDLDS